MMDVTMRENGSPITAADLIASLEWHRKSEPDANISLNPVERDELLALLTPLTSELSRHYPHFMPDVDVIGEWRASHMALEAALLRCLREIQPHHIPGDVYEQAQRALGNSSITSSEGKL